MKLRHRAVEQGLRISEYGGFRVEEEGEGEATEEEVYAAVGLPWIAPELREDRGEVERAGRGPEASCANSLYLASVSPRSY